MQNKILAGRANSIHFWDPAFYIVYHWKNNKKTLSNIARPGIAYITVFRKNSKANETVVFSCLHDTVIDALVTRISSNEKLLDEKCAMI